eukprot:31502-Pelagococcus_subviridis.AAC.13
MLMRVGGRSLDRREERGGRGGTNARARRGVEGASPGGFARRTSRGDGGRSRARGRRRRSSWPSSSRGEECASSGRCWLLFIL